MMRSCGGRAHGESAREVGAGIEPETDCGDDVEADEDESFEPVGFAVGNHVAHSVHCWSVCVSRASKIVIVRLSPEIYRTMDSNGSNNSASGLSRTQPRRTMNGITNRAVCCI